MIERFYLKEYLSFKEAELEFDNGLIVFTGPSGSGKSILMRSILASLGLDDAEASLSESSVNWQIDEEATGLSNEESNTFRQVKKEKVRYFVNNQSLSKRALQELCSRNLRHLSLKDYSDFDNDNLLALIDGRIERDRPEHAALLARYRDTLVRYKEVSAELRKLEEEEQRIVELKEFAAFEIAKIEEIAPKPAEDEELMAIKKLLSQREKAQEKIAAAEAIFENEYAVSSALQALEIQSDFFDDAMNELRAHFEHSMERFNELDEIDIESVLDRIEALSSLKQRYGGIEEAIAYKMQKIEELERYENIEIAKGEGVKEIAALEAELEAASAKISSNRRSALEAFETGLNSYLKQLYLRPAHITIEAEEAFMGNGRDRVNVALEGTTLDKVSSGEFNRLRLALLALKSETMHEHGGVLMLDEIDANLSGEESMSVAKVLRQLSKRFQIFVISHQPQLTSMGDQHFLVYKTTQSQVRPLEQDERVDEIARMVSGDRVTEEAKRLAIELLESAACVL